MRIVDFNTLYNTEFFIKEPMSKTQNWASRGNVYNALGKPKISHTLLWFKNCRATITDKNGNVLEAEQNQLAYMAKGIEYKVQFHDTRLGQVDTVVIHFQMTDSKGEDIAPTLEPIICMKKVESSFALTIDMLADEFRKNIVCMPEVTASIYKILSNVCQNQKNKTTRNKFTCIHTGIELLEQDSDLSISEIAEKTGVSECYFRRLFQEYSGESPMNFRQRHRIEKAKQLLVSDEEFSIGEIAQELNFSDIYHFSKTFKKYCGISPTEYLKNEKK